MYTFAALENWPTLNSSLGMDSLIYPMIWVYYPWAKLTAHKRSTATGLPSSSRASNTTGRNFSGSISIMYSIMYFHFWFLIFRGAS